MKSQVAIWGAIVSGNIWSASNRPEWAVTWLVIAALILIADLIILWRQHRRAPKDGRQP